MEYKIKWLLMYSLNIWVRHYNATDYIPEMLLGQNVLDTNGNFHTKTNSSDLKENLKFYWRNVFQESHKILLHVW